MDSLDSQIADLPIELRLCERRGRMHIQVWRKLVIASCNGGAAPEGVGEMEWADLLIFHQLLCEAFEVRQKSSIFDRELEVAQAQIASSPLEQWPALIEARNEAQGRLNDCLVKTQFLATQNYRFSEFFRDYVPLAVHARLKISA